MGLPSPTPSQIPLYQRDSIKQRKKHPDILFCLRDIKRNVILFDLKIAIDAHKEGTTTDCSWSFT